MQFSPEEATFTLDRVRKLIDEQGTPPELICRKLWMTLGSIHSQALANAARSILGDKIVGGPFEGMQLNNAAYYYSLPLMLGNYEHELHKTVEAIVAKNYKHIANIGCSIGYYAVGLARRMPNTLIDAFDIDPEAQKHCAKLASLNGVSDRLHIHGLFEGERFATYLNEPSLIFMDIEGGEVDLLDPARYPALQKLDVVVELHDLFRPDISSMMAARFASTHDIEIIYNRNMMPNPDILYKNAKYIDPFDQILLDWECRDGATPWGIFTAKKQ